MESYEKGRLREERLREGTEMLGKKKKIAVRNCYGNGKATGRERNGTERKTSERKKWEGKERNGKERNGKVTGTEG